LAVLDVVLTRWDYNFSSVIASITYDRFTPTVKLNSYIPTWQDFALGTGIISYWLLGFSLAAGFLPFSTQRAGDKHTPA
jgi:Ni/Fe-hydrogenase subunit HybB-like protein